MPRTMTGTTAEVTLHIAAVPAPELRVAPSVTARSKVAGTARRELLQKSPPPPARYRKRHGNRARLAILDYSSPPQR